MFLRYVERSVGALGDLIGAACTINEPNIVSVMGYGLGIFPPGRLDRDEYRAANDNFIDAHRRAVPILRAGPGSFDVGLTLSMSDHHAVPADDPEAIARVERERWSMEDQFLDVVDGDDFLGVQVYSRTRIGPNGHLGPEAGVPTLPMGYEYWPESLGACLRYAWSRTGGRVPLLVTENGIGTDDDAQRIDYVRSALHGVLDCLDEGIDVRGYMYWSLLDNFEWAFGYRPRFGIIAVDRATQRRTVKPSGEWLGAIARSNTL